MRAPNAVAACVIDSNSKAICPRLPPKLSISSCAAGNFAVQPLRFALQRSHVFFSLNDLVAHLRGRGHRFHHILPPRFLLPLQVRE